MPTTGFDQGIIDSVSLANSSVFGDTMSSLQTLSLQNAIAANQVGNSNMLSHQAAVNQMSVAVLAKAINKISDPQIEAAAATEKYASSGLSESMANLLGALNAGQEASKISQSVPPETAKKPSAPKAA